MVFTLDVHDVTKSDGSDSDDEEEHLNDSIVVSDHTSQGSLSESEEEFVFTDTESEGEGEPERPFKRLRKNST